MKIMRREITRKIRRRFCSATLAGILGITTIFAGNTDWIAKYKVSAQENATKVTEEEEQVNAGDYGLCDNSKDGAILHAFCWSFNTIKQNLADIAAAGYTTVQTSPINACFAGEGGGMELFGNGKWYYHYQPTDWTIGNYQLGSRDEYKAMCEEADKYGVKIISDVLPNHTTPTLDAVSNDLANAAGGKTAGALYHNNGFNRIQDGGDWSWGNRLACTTGMMGGLPDVNTENQGFQEYYLKFCNDVIACGGDGFRYDTAKHIGVPSDPKDSANTRGVNDFWDVVTGKKAVNGVSLNNKDKQFIYGEVLQDNGIPYEEYASYMEMTASGYGGTLRGAVGSKDFGTGRISDWNHSTPDKIVTWVESHDTYCNDHESGWMTDTQIRMCWAVIAARKQGTPLFFSRPDGSNGSSGNYWGNNKIGAKGNDQFKDPEVAACNHFRNAMVGESEYMSNPNGNNSVLVIERGTKGAVIINMGSDTSNIKLSKVADGSYTEEVSGSTVQVSGGVLNYTVPAGKIAVVYNAGTVTKNPNVSVSKDSGTFTEAFTLTLTPANASKATYSVNGGDAVEFTTKTTVKIGDGCSVGDKVTVKVTATGEGDAFEKTFTYTMVEVPEAKFLVRVKKSDFSTAPYIYAYSGSGTSSTVYAGKWPGTQMTDDGDYYVFMSDSTESATVILHDNGSWRNTKEGETEVVVSGMAEYDKSSNKFTTITATTKPSATTAAPATTKPAATTAAPATTKPAATTAAPATTKPAATTAAPSTTKPTTVAGPNVSVSLENGSTFRTETQDVKLTFNNATKVTYSVDGGPKKTIDASKNQDATVTLGQGKIANSQITLEVEVTDGKTTNKQTFKYTKEFVKSKSTSEILSVFASTVMNKITETAETVEAGSSSNDSLAPQYGTNTAGIGVKKSITVDDSVADWTEDMLIAQGAANDDPRVYRPNSMYEVGVDEYALYGAYDDSNLYLMWEMTNIQDVVAPNDDFPLTQGTMYLNMNVPFFIAVDTGKSDAIGNKGALQTKGTIWSSGITIEQSFNRLIAISTNGANGPYVYGGDSTGLNSVEMYSKAGGGKAGAEKSGIQFGYGKGILSSSVKGINGAYGENNNRVVGDVCDASADWVDFNTLGHKSASMDYHYEMAIPLTELGISASDVASSGLGVLVVATMGKSGMDCLPYDVSMNDQADLDDAAGSQENNSFEKSDEDNITCSFARIGNGTINTSKPVVTTAPTTTKPSTTVPSTTKPVATTAAPSTTKPVATTAAPTTTKPTVTSTPSTEKIYCVNFGADKSSPQLSSTELTLKAEGYDGTTPYNYEFYIDGEVVQKSSTTDTYTWKNASAGDHVIKVVMKDKDGNETTKQKKYVIENDDVIETAKPTVTNTPSVTTVPTVTVKPTATPNVNQENLSVSLSTDKKSSQVKGTKITLLAAASGGSGNYKYNFMVEDEDGNITNLAINSTTASATWKASKTGIYRLVVTVTDTESGNTEFAAISYKIILKKSLKYNYLKANKSTIKVKKKVTLTASGTAGTGKVQYKFYYKKKGAKSSVTIQKYSTTKKCTWKAPSKAGTYYVYCKIKDGSNKTLIKKVVIKVKK